MLPEQWIKSTRSKRTTFLASFVLIGAIAVYNWIVAPHRNYLMAAQRYQSVAGELSKKNQIISNNITIKKKEIKELQEEFKQVQSMLFDPLGVGKFFSDIQIFSEEANCVVDSLTFSPASRASDTDSPETNSYITAHRAILSVMGGYGSIVALINKLQERQQQVRIDSIRLTSDGNNYGDLKCDMTITVYTNNRKEENHHV